MADETSIFIGASRKPDDSYQQPEELLLKYGNRHGLVTGATGTGKTVTLQILAEGFSNQGVPVFCADIKGDLSGVAMLGEPRISWRVPRQSSSNRTNSRNSLSSSGICSASRAIRSGRRSPRWGRCFCRG